MVRYTSPKKKKQCPNPSGRNQHQNGKLMDAIPDLAEWLQKAFDRGVRQKDIPKKFEKDFPGMSISPRSISRYVTTYGIRTPHMNRMTDIEVGSSILKLKEDDPLGRFGCRVVKGKLARQSVHVTRDFAMKFLHAENPDGAAARHPHTRKAHSHGLTSAGSNEEWGIDGHEKITKSMGISVYGCIDKWSRMELGLWACPNARDQDLPLALWLRVVHKYGGMSVNLTCDMGTELGKIIPVITGIREKYQPYLDEDTIPAVTACKSTKNITRERAWRPLWEKELANVAHVYKTGMIDAGFHPNDEFHQVISRWVWAQVVQARLDNHMIENACHRPRVQKILLPSGIRRIDLYESPEDYGGSNLLIPIPSPDIDRLLAEHDDHHLTQFGSDGQVALFEDLHTSIGSPPFCAKYGWSIFSQMVELYRARMYSSDA